ncbi:MAG: hypothetical protein A2X36_01140 [Elusimicrobia bacterium GWA2_69_24]|nr:MAG: hypothetical protein A2X36_01140 [Elusimicrobia bacterium GWA2_69_24]
MAELMTAERPPGLPVACDHEGTVDWRGFQGATADLCVRLQGDSGGGDGRWLLACESSYAFAVGLSALWQTGNIAVLPPNLQAGSLEDCREGLRGWISDLPAGAGGGVRRLAPVSGAAGSFPWRRLEPARVCVELFTSGSTGERKRVPKTLAQLEAEVVVLEDAFGELLGDCPVLATVSHQHIYGMLFRLLWPLCAGRPFHAHMAFLWEEIFAMMGRLPAGAIVTSPVHLDRIGAPPDGPARLPGCRALFSSGGPLKRASSERAFAVAGCAPIEVFGSTETGGVGWRRQSGGGGPEVGPEWTPFPGVSLSVADRGPEAGRLCVRSVPAGTGPGGPALVMGDRGEVLPDGRFRSSGRMDRIAKIAEERFSLDEMERRLQEHPWVARARTLLLPGGGGGRSGRDFVGAVVVPAEPAQRELRERGRLAFSRVLREHLRRHFEPVTLPRHFRFVAAFPTDAQGKTTAAALKGLFHPPYDPAVTEPQVLESVLGPDGLTLRLRVPEDLGYLDGHFPEFPVVPGVVQTKWVWAAAATLLGRVPEVRALEAVKFKELLLPGRAFSLRVHRQRKAGSDKLCYELTDGDVLFSSGRFLLGAPSTGPAEPGA